MKKTLRCLLSIIGVACLSSVSLGLHAAQTKPHKSASAQNHKATSKATPKASVKAKRGTTARKRAAADDANCKTVRVKTARGHRTQRKCTSVDSVLHSPIGAGALNGQSGAGKPSELKARTIPDRAYAVDGYTFFHQGRKYRVIGVDEALVPAASDLAKQRLQLALDSGTISVEPETVDENGTMRAVVKIAGKNLADVLNASR